MNGQNARNGPWGHRVDASVGEEIGGSIFADAGMKALDLPCDETFITTTTRKPTAPPRTNTQTHPLSALKNVKNQPQHLPTGSDEGDVFADVFSRNPDGLTGNYGRRNDGYINLDQYGRP